jgi:CheY-like chemotaxis protein
MSQPRIVMLEYDQDDRYITEEFFAESGRKVTIDFVTNSDDFLKYLDRCTKNNRSYPSIILMNQQATPQSALTLLKQLKASPDYGHIPVVVLGSLSHPVMTKEFYAAGASSFIQKPFTGRDTRDKIANFIKYWFDTVELV